MIKGTYWNRAGGGASETSRFVRASTADARMVGGLPFIPLHGLAFAVNSRLGANFLSIPRRVGGCGLPARNFHHPDFMENEPMKSKILLISLIIIGVGVIVLLQTKKPSFHQSGRSQREKGVQAPNFVLPDLDGKMVSLADYKGKVVLLNIWATWCGPCVEEMPSMEKLHQEMKGEDFAILAVSIDVSGDSAVIPFMKKHNLSFTALLDPKGTINHLYKTSGVPESFIIDQQGIIVETVIGAHNWASASVVGYLRNLIRGKQR